MKSSVSSVLAERIRQRRAVTPAKHSVRYVKFSPEEMAYDAPADVSHLPFKPAKASRGVEKLRQALNAEHGYVKLEPDLAAFFKDDRIVNETLRRAMEIMKLKPGAKRRKTA